MLQPLHHIRRSMVDNTERSIQWGSCVIAIAVIDVDGGKRANSIPIRPGFV